MPPKKSAPKPKTKPAAAPPKAKKAVKKAAAAPPAAKPAPVAARPVAPAVVAPTAAPVDLLPQLTDLWTRFEAHVATLGGPTLGLRPPASDKDVATAEKLLKVRFPPGLRASLRVHDGQDAFGAKDARSFPWLPGQPPLAPLEQIVERWAALQALAGKRRPSDDLIASDRIKAGAHRTGRLAIAGRPRWTGDAAYLDLDPGKAGVPGQLIASIGDAWFVVDTAFEVALARWLFVLERGLWTYDRDQHLAFPTGRADLAVHAAGLFSKR